MVLFLLKEQNTTAEHVRLRRVSRISNHLKPTGQLDNMIDTLVWERDLDLSGQKGRSGSNLNINLGSTHNTFDLNQSISRPTSPLRSVSESRAPSPPPPQFVTNEFPTPSSIPQPLRGDQKPVRRSEFSELRARPSFIDYEDLEMFRRTRPLTMASNVWHPQPIRRPSMMPVDADGYRDLLLDVEQRYREEKKYKRPSRYFSRDTSASSIRSRTSDTTIC